MNELKIDVKRYGRTHVYHRHQCGSASGALYFFPSLKAVYHSSGYLLTEGLSDAFQFAKFCNAFEIGSEVRGSYFRAARILEASHG